MGAPPTPELGAWSPSRPLTAAERFVDFPAHNTHIVEQRYRVERAALPVLRRLVFVITEYGLPTLAAQEALELRLDSALVRSLRFGQRQARHEIRSMRRHSQRERLPGSSAVRPAATRKGAARSRCESLLAYQIPDAGHYSRLSRDGLEGIKQLIRERARSVARNVATFAAQEAYRQATNPDRLLASLAVLNVAKRSLHNQVLELVGETLNLGRTVGALESDPVPEFAMRSEQLDGNTCDECDALHGEIVEMGSPEYFELLPPNDCLGGGRCRGLMIFGE